MSKPEYYIESLWILNHAGILLFEENYVDFAQPNQEGIPTDLITAFLSAILTFSDEAFADAIEHIQFSNRKMIFKSSEHVLFVIAAGETSANDTQIKKMIDEIAAKFGEKFNDYFEQMEFFDGKVSRFDNFSEDLRLIVKKEPTTVKFLRSLGLVENIKRMEELYQLRKERFQNRMKKIEGFFQGLSGKIDPKKKAKKEKDKLTSWYID